MTILWLITGASLVVALVALSQARRTAKRLALMSEMYWEMKYQQGELRVRVQRLSGEGPPPPALPPLPAQAPQGALPAQAPEAGQPGETFVPLSSLKR